jgi:hypothetical protein
VPPQRQEVVDHPFVTLQNGEALQLRTAAVDHGTLELHPVAIADLGALLQQVNHRADTVVDPDQDDPRIQLQQAGERTVEGEVTGIVPLGQVLCQAAHRGDRMGGVPTAAGPGPRSQGLGNLPHQRRRVVAVPDLAGSLREEAAENRHGQRALFPKHIQEGVYDSVRASFHPSERPQRTVDESGVPGRQSQAPQPRGDRAALYRGPCIHRRSAWAWPPQTPPIERSTQR